MFLIRRLSFLGQLAYRETFRLLGPLVRTIMIVIGITVPLALLCGLANGLIRKQEDDFLKSPSAIELSIAAASGAKPLTSERESQLLAEYPSIVNIIPDITKLVDFSVLETGKSQTGVTVRCTKAGDPLLRFYKVDVLGADELGVVLSSGLAERLGLRFAAGPGRTRLIPPGQTLEMRVGRQEPNGSGSVVVTLAVRGVADFGQNVRIAYLSRRLIDEIENYQQGQTVERLGWAGFSQSVPVAYAGYLVFSKTAFSQLDETKLKSLGLSLRQLSEQRTEDSELRTLHGLLRPHHFLVYWVFAEGAQDSPDVVRLQLQPAMLEAVTAVDDLVVPWSEPIVCKIGSRPLRLVGISLQKRWLKQSFLNVTSAFAQDDDSFDVRLTEPIQIGQSDAELEVDGCCPLPVTISSPVADSPDSLHHIAGAACDYFSSFEWICGNGLALGPNSEIPPVADSDGRLPVAVTNASFLSRLHSYVRHEAIWDAHLQQLVPKYYSNEYYQARIITRSIHDIPAADDIFRKLGYATQSQRTRVEELREYAATLHLLVWIVGATLMTFGIWTLVAALADNTARKKRSLGTLRALGASRWTIFFLFMLRAGLLGVTAGLATAGIALGGSRILSLQLAPCLIDEQHLLSVFCLALASCLLGAIAPAIWAAQASPAHILRESGRC